MAVNGIVVIIQNGDLLTVYGLGQGNDTDLVAAGFGIIDTELSTVDQGVLGVGLDDVELEGLGVGLVGGGSVVLTVLQEGLVAVALTGNDGIAVQHGRVVDDDLIVGFQMITEILSEDHMEGAAVSQTVDDDLIVFCFHGLGTNTGDHMLDRGHTLEGQTCGHGIVQDIVLCTGVDINGSLEVDGLTDVSGVAVAPVACRVLLDLLVDGGRGVLGVDGGLGVGGGQTAQGTHGGVHQIPAQLQAGELTGGHASTRVGGDDELTVILGGLDGCDAVGLGVSQSLLGGEKPAQLALTL